MREGVDPLPTKFYKSEFCAQENVVKGEGGGSEMWESSEQITETGERSLKCSKKMPKINIFFTRWLERCKRRKSIDNLAPPTFCF
jgi:hypothetical protein